MPATPTKKAAKPAGSSGVGARIRYSQAVKQQVRERYPLCRTTADKERLARELGIDSVQKLYNLASRLGATQVDEAEHAATILRSGEHLSKRETPETIKWTAQADEYITQEFGKRPPGLIARYLDHSEAALIYRARQLGLRKPVRNWDLHKVAHWLGMSEDEFRTLADEGVDIYPICDRRGHLQIELVSITSLGRWLQTGDNRQRLVEPDEFFLLEVEESLAAVAAGKLAWESCKFLSYGHICQNAYTENSFGLFCPNNERYRAGEDPRCSVRLLELEDVAGPAKYHEDDADLW